MNCEPLKQNNKHLKNIFRRRRTTNKRTIPVIEIDWKSEHECSHTDVYNREASNKTQQIGSTIWGWLNKWIVPATLPYSTSKRRRGKKRMNRLHHSRSGKSIRTNAIKPYFNKLIIVSTWLLFYIITIFLLWQNTTKYSTSLLEIKHWEDRKHIPAIVIVFERMKENDTMAQIENKFSSSTVFYYVIIIQCWMEMNSRIHAHLAEHTQQNEHEMMIYIYIRLRIYREKMAKIFEIYYGLENEWMNECVYCAVCVGDSVRQEFLSWDEHRTNNNQVLHLICFSPMTFWFLFVINLCLKYSWNVQCAAQH